MDILHNQSFKFSFPQFLWFQAVVEGINDPLKLGRVQVRIIGYHTDNKTLIPSENLLWASVSSSINSASMSGIGQSPTGLLNGSWVWGFFMDGEDCQQAMIVGSLHGVSTINDNSKGFNDPNGEYPLPQFLNESDVNRLARNDNIIDTIIKVKQDNEDLNVQTAFNVIFSQPATPNYRKYPKNHVKSTESGIIEEFDDSDKQARYHRYHPSGTFTEEHFNGDKVVHVKNDKYEVIFKDDNLHVKGKVNITVEGDANIKVNGNSNNEIMGNLNQYVHGDYQLKVDGDIKIKSGGSIWQNSDSKIFLNCSAPTITFS